MEQKMAEMKTERKSVLEYLSKNKFLIPIYQRKYTWEVDECEQLWGDIRSFFENKEDDEEYFLGSIVMYKDKSRQNIIDGQQRTTTLSLLIKALYDKAIAQTNSNVKELTQNLARCLWDINPLNGEIEFSKKHLSSEVAIEADNEILMDILSNRESSQKAQKSKSLYQQNYLYFKDKIDDFAKEKPSDWFDFCLCLLNSCILLPIECDGQENALRIFNTLNNRGVSLSTADIFKGIIYESKKDDKARMCFAKEWKELEAKLSDSKYLRKEDMGFLFAQYEHILRALHNEVDTVIPSVLDFFTKKDKLNTKKKSVNFGANEDLLKKDESFQVIKDLAEFWCDPTQYFSHNAKKYFDMLNVFQNKLWQMVVTMAFYTHRPQKVDDYGLLSSASQNNIFDEILPQIVAYLGIALIYGKGGNTGIFWGLMKANINIKDKKSEIFETSLNLPNLEMPKLEYFIDSTSKMLPKQVRYLLVINVLEYDSKQQWEWNVKNKNHIVTQGEIEHILPKKWQDTNYQGWDRKDADSYLEHIGNKMLLEKKLNIECGNGYFGQKKEKYADSSFCEAKSLSKYPKNDWLKVDIEKRDEQVYERLKHFFAKQL